MWLRANDVHAQLAPKTTCFASICVRRAGSTALKTVTAGRHRREAGGSAVECTIIRVERESTLGITIDAGRKRG